MKKFYRANQHGKKIIGTESSNPNSTWRKLEQQAGLTKDVLKSHGYRVKMVIDLEESDVIKAVDVAEQLAPRPVKGIIGILKGLFGR